MPRDVDEKKTRKALRKLRKARERAEAEGIDLSEWESEFVEGVEERLETYGSAFADPSLGNRDEALSNAQTEILRQLDRKSRGKSSGGFKTRKPLKARKPIGNGVSSQRSPAPENSDNHSDNNTLNAEPVVPYTENLPVISLVKTGSEKSPKTGNGTKRSPEKRVGLRLIQGGKAD